MPSVRTLPAKSTVDWYGWAQDVDAAVRSPLGAKFVNVENYGASNANSAAANLTALNNAVSTLTNGSVLYFPPGAVYQLSDTLTVQGLSDLAVIMDGATLIGSGSSDSAAVLRLVNCNHGRVQGGTLRHATAGPRRNDADGLSLVHCTDFDVTSVKIGYVYSIGIRMGGCLRVSIYGNTVNGSVADGIGAYGATRQPSNDVNMTAGSSIITSATARFTDGDVGAIVQIGAGAGGAQVNVPIVSVQSGTQATLQSVAQVNVVNAYIRITRVSEDVNIFGNHLPGTGDDSISSVGYRVYDSVPVGPNKNINVYGNTVRKAGARGVTFVGVWGGTIVDNIVDSARQGSVYVSTEPSVGGSWGTQDIEVAGNVLNDSNTDFGNGDSNYGAISIDSVFEDYPVQNINVHDNIIRSPKSYYLRIGGDAGQATNRGTREIYVSNNRCIGGNANNFGVVVTKASDVYLDGNRIDKAATHAIYIDPNCGGVLAVRGGSISAYGQKAYGEAIAAPASTIISAVIVNGVLTNAPTGGTTPPAGGDGGTGSTNLLAPYLASTNDASGWTAERGAVSVTTSGPYTAGGSSIRLTATAAEANVAMAKQADFIPVTAGQTVTFTVQTKANIGDLVQAWVNFWTDSGGYVSGLPGAMITADGNWKTATATVTVPGGATKINVYVQTSGGANHLLDIAAPTVTKV